MLFLLSCSGSFVNDEEIILIKGSDTMLQLTEKLSEVYSDINPSIKFRVYGGGTKSGISELLNGRIDICMASRNLTPSEAKVLAEYYGSIGMYYLIAKDAVSIYVNSDNPIENLSSKQLKNVFTCTITNMKEVSNNSGKISLAIRSAESGTRKFVKDMVLGSEKFCSDAVEFKTTEELIEYIQDNQYAIGFGGLGLAEEVKIISVDGIKPNVQNAKNDTYPLTRYLHFFTSKSSSGNVKKFIDWVLSPDGQRIVKEEGFIPLWEINY